MVLRFFYDVGIFYLNFFWWFILPNILGFAQTDSAISGKHVGRVVNIRSIRIDGASGFIVRLDKKRAYVCVSLSRFEWIGRW